MPGCFRAPVPGECKEEETMRNVLWALLGSLALLAMAAAAITAAPAEYRGFWADGFSPGFRTAEETDTLLGRLKEANCNAIWAQMRKSGDAYYQSTYEPWAVQDPQHFDALEYLLQKAHSAQPRLQVHVWMNTCAVGGNPSPNHIVKKHPEYLSLSDTGESYDDEAVKIDPGNPGAADWTFRVYLDVVRHYDVDGIHFDFVRYGGQKWGYSPASVALFNEVNQRTGNPAWDDPLWQQWRRDAVTALVRKVYVFTKALKPDVAVSAATICWGSGPEADGFTSSTPYTRVYQDWRSWLEEGILDINCPMMYYQNSKHRDWWLKWVEFGKDHTYGKRLVVGLGNWFNPIPDTFQQIADVRQPSPTGKKADGMLLFSYGGTNADASGKEISYNEDFYKALAQPSQDDPKGPLAEAAVAPKIGALKGTIVKGFVLEDPSLKPCVRAKVTLEGPVKREMVTDITGFYAFLAVPPGDYRLTVQPAAEGLKDSTPQQSLRIRNGARCVTDNRFLSADGKPTRRVSSDWLVTAGTDGLKDVIYVRRRQPGLGRKVMVKDQDLALQPGDVVAISRLPGSLDLAVRFAGMENQDKLEPVLKTSIPALLRQRSRAATGKRVEIEGTVSETLPSGFMLSGGNKHQVQVDCTLLNETPQTMPAPGQKVRVRGVVDFTDTELKVCPANARSISVE